MNHLWLRNGIWRGTRAAERPGKHQLGGRAPEGGPAGALIEWAWTLRHLPMSETPAKIDFSAQKMGFVFANEF